MALEQQQGRSKSQQTAAELQEIITEELKDLSPDEIEALQVLLADLKTQAVAASPSPGSPVGAVVPSGIDPDGIGGLLGHFQKTHFIRQPVDLQTFVLDEYYLGKTCDTIYPQVLEDLQEIFRGNYNEIILTGAIGIGKTFESSIGVVRVLYELSCMRHPQKSFGLSADTEIVIAAFSVNEDLAKEVVLKNVIGKVKASPYFNEHFKPRITQKNIRFPNNIKVVARATTDRGALGMSILAAIMDESDFMPKKRATVGGGDRFGVQSMAKAIYDGIKRRMKSRFGKAGKLFLPCSKTTVESFIAKRIFHAKNDPTIFVRDYALWEVKPGDYSAETFTVLCGNEQVRSKILTDEEAQTMRLDPPERTVLVDVPSDFKPEFEQDLEGAIRDIAGVATVAMSPFIQQIHKITEMVDSDRIHPFSSEILDPSVGGQFILSKMLRQYQLKDPMMGHTTVIRPLLNPSAQRHVHVDLALNGCAAGLCMGHVAGWKPIDRKTPDGQHTYTDKAPFFVIDLILQIVPPPGGEIEISMVRQMIYDLTAKGYPIAFVSMDQWQCLARGTRVNTDRGLLPIEEVQEGDMVQSRIGARPVVRTFSFGEKPTLRVITDDGEVLEGTPHHRIEAQVGWTPLQNTRHGHTREPVWEWKRLDDLEVGDILRVQEDPVSLDVPDALLFGDKEALGWRAGGRAGLIDSWDPPRRMTPELAEFLGLVWGDGDIGRDGVRLSVGEGEEGDAQDVFEACFGVRPSYFPWKDRKGGVLRVSGRWFVRWLGANGLTKPTIPEAILRSSRGVKAAFLRGLFAADASVARNDGRVNFDTIHRVLADQVRLLLRTEFGIASRLITRQRGRKGEYPTSRSCAYVVGLRGARADWLDRVGFSYASKREALEKHRGVRGRRIFTRVLAIETSRAEVFDIEVEEDHAYVANGIVSHNSADSLQQLKSKGYEVDLISMDRNWDPYKTAKNALYENRVSCYHYAPLLAELRGLEADWAKRKVVKPEGGSKDVSDAFAGVLYSLATKRVSEPLPMMKGISQFGDPGFGAIIPEQLHAAGGMGRRAMMNQNLHVQGMPGFAPGIASGIPVPSGAGMSNGYSSGYGVPDVSDIIPPFFMGGGNDDGGWGG